MTYDGSTVKSYIDGSLVDSGSLTLSNTVGTISSIQIGLSSASRHLNGSIDQVRIYSTALTSSQVTELYEEKPCADTSNFKTVLYEGNGGTQYISNVGFDLDVDNGGDGGLVWVKNRDGSNSHVLQDSVRGAGSSKTIHSDLTAYEGQYGSYGNISSFDANGFFPNAGSNGANNTNLSNNSYVAWVWKGGGDAVTGTGSNLTSISKSTNTDAGFSIVKYTSSGTSGASFSHGLGAPPDMVIIKCTSTTGNWITSVTNVISDKYLYLNNSGTGGTGGFAVSGTNVTLNNTFGDANASGRTYVAYCWHSVAEYSKIGSYEGNGASAITTITTGFEPSWVMIKRTDSANDWVIFDNKRDTTSPLSKILYADLSDSEAEGGTTTSINITGTGFNMSTSQFGGSINTDGGQYLYMAFK